MTRKKRPSFAEFREALRTTTPINRTALVEAADLMHDRLRDEVYRAVSGAGGSKLTAGFMTFSGVPNVLMVTHASVDRAVRAVFDRRKRKRGTR